LFEESYQAVGDLAETISLVLPETPHTSTDRLTVWIENKLLPLRSAPPRVLAEHLPALWAQLDRQGLMLCIKLITGSFRVGVSKSLVTRAVAAMAGLDGKRVAQRLVGYTDPSHRPNAASYLKLIAPEAPDEHAQRDGQPYPFFLAHALSQPVEQFEALLGPASQWQVEWKWDGIRAQVVKRDGRLWVWSRGEELVTERFPELGSLAHDLPDGTVIDGEIVAWKTAPSGSGSASDRPSPTSLAVHSLSPCCKNAAAVTRWTRKSSMRCPWSSRPLTCWNGRARICATRLRPCVALSWNISSPPAQTRCYLPRPC
jgi:DNA ligase-1